MPQFLETASGRRIAYHKTDGTGPGVVFLGGFMSDMEGSKAVHLEQWARAQGRAYLRLDYSGHGVSTGKFTDGSIGDWAADAAAAITALTDGAQILVGSSMGGWISLILARQMPEEVAGLVGIAAAPDFTEDGYWSRFDADQRENLLSVGHVSIPNDYDAPYTITRRLIEDGRENLVLRAPLNLAFPARFLLGTADTSVDVSVATRLLEHATGDDIQLTLVKGANHSFSTPDCLRMIEMAIAEVTSRAKA